MKKFAAPFAIGTLFVSQALAASATGTANANVVSAISVSEMNPLDFGTFSSGATPGIISNMGPSSGGVTVIRGGTVAGFAVNGTPNANYHLTLPESAILSSGSNTMTAHLFSAGSEQPLGSTGYGNFFVTGTLSVAANQPPGTYSGTYIVSINY